MSRFELLVGSDAFWERARHDIARAKQRVLVQAMTFEGDRTGLAVAEAIGCSRASDRRVLVDSYSRFIVSDQFVFSPWARRNPEFRNEVRETAEMFRRLERQGAGVFFTNPVGFLATRFPARNHKKLLVMDNIAYLGGINFSDHNFAWHDLMLRCEDADIADYLSQDFTHTFADEAQASHAQFDGVELLSMSGVANELLFSRLLSRIEHARKRIDVFSPYLTFPFCESLARARERGVQVVLYTPLANNKGIVRDYLLWAAERFGFVVRLYDRMSHLKAMLIDDEALVVGSSNFDFVSYHSQAEYVAIVTVPEVVAEFRAKVLEPDDALAVDAPQNGRLRGPIAFAMLKVAESATRFTGGRLRAEQKRAESRAERLRSTA
ncbi:MAG TPA: phosphatidylserine/phosphatidylglycerophosphate/cardiolipin synthase family protein [Polyangiales bacterium]|nr:phosphatidylserine/phosphatidylglycerophosphate/cardiolipin synthase family protein [Polyangiales bacterium]